jgi:predicted Zn-dependent protease
VSGSGPSRSGAAALAVTLALLAACANPQVQGAIDKTRRTGGALASKGGELAGKTVEKGGELAEKGAEHGKAVAKTTSRELRKGFADLTPQEEYYIGRSVAARILGTHRAVEDPAAAAYLNALGVTLARSSALPETYGGWHFLLLDSDEVNAFAAPGGFVFVTRGLFRSCRNEEQLAAVVAHEIGHVALRHGLASIKSTRLTEAFATISSEAVREFTGADLKRLTAAFAGTVDDIIDQMVAKGYSSTQEGAADREAVLVAYRAGYDPAGMAQFLGILAERAAGAGKKGFFATHPEPGDRLRSVEGFLAGKKLAGATDPARTARFTGTR